MKNQKTELTQAQRDELRAFASIPDDEIDTSDIPEIRDWSGAVRGLLHMPPDERAKAMEKLRSRRTEYARDNGSGPSDWTRYEWAPPTGYVGVYIAEETKRTLDAYRVQPTRVAEDANHEEDTARGGYARRQLFELVQNSADALSGSEGGHIWIGLTRDYLYCADEGKPIDKDGVRALMFAYLSPKRGTDEIGRFGLGFKSVLGVTDRPEFFSRSGSFRFDREKATSLVRPIARDTERYPVLRLPEAIDPDSEMDSDPILSGLMDWASNIVRLPLKESALENLERQMEEFPAEFLLFVEHVSELTLQNDNQGTARTFSLSREDGLRLLNDGENTTRWMVVKSTHELSSEARADSRSLDDTGKVPISWAAPLDRLNDPGKFWAFFPTVTTSLLAGILNAPWKTNEDRQNLLPGPYNDELITAAATMVADALPKLSTTKDPARHLDALPRRHEAGDNEQSSQLRQCLYESIRNRKIVPNQGGILRDILEISYPPETFADEALERWSRYDKRPSNWAHHSVLTPRRLARLGLTTRSYSGFDWAWPKLQRATIAEWLEALTKISESEQDKVQASMAAIQTVSLIPKSVRGNNDLGEIVLTSSDNWVKPDPESVFLGGEDTSSQVKIVHPELQSDPDTLHALRELGLRPVSPEIAFREVVSTWTPYQPDPFKGYTTSQEYYRWMDKYWSMVFSTLDQDTIQKGVKSFSGRKEISGLRILYSLLNDGYTDRPKYEVWMDRYWSMFWPFARDVEARTAAKIIQESQYDWRDVIKIRTVDGSWRPLFNVLLPGPIVPEDGSRDTHIAIDVQFHQDDLALLEELGAVDSPHGSYSLPWEHYRSFKQKCEREFRAQDLQHNPAWNKIDFISAIASGPLSPFERLSEEGKALYTESLLNLQDTYKKWTMHHNVTYDCSCPKLDFESPVIGMLREYGRVSTDDGIHKLSDGIGDQPKNVAVREKLLSHPQADLIRKAFGISAEESEPDDVYDYYIATDVEVRRAREEVRKWSTDELRLLAAVGEDNLRLRLPPGLIQILEADNNGALNGVQIAQAAIATYHTGALHEYRDSLGHLDPPRRWAGSPSAVAFVQSLGFSEEWAMARNVRRTPFIEVTGPYSLPPLHGYQQKIVSRVRDFIQSNGSLGERRGMISMPTGSGKTRVAVQSVVEAMREDGLEGDILWVADRDELCEQAVEAWQQVWSSEGVQGAQLQISRMWGGLWSGQPELLPTAQKHVIVATIQTLKSKMNSYKFNFKLLVFDEAHRSVAPTFTSVMQELGLTRWRRDDEPVLIGLTATPYRGYDARETARLVNRYGQNRLDSGAFKSDDPEAVIGELQDMRVLARADHDTIEGGYFSLSGYEAQQASETPWLPQSVENRIARDTDRTRRIVETYREKVDPGAPTLIFATSVEHSQVLAALLTSKGVSARAVSADTDRFTRRRIVEQFRAGEIKVLVNYGIFREGFDAPKTRAIIVARPVYSPNLYFQMIGRGLRGVKNGGNDRCLILNVEDNIENFERKLAFSELDWLWD